LIGSFADDDGMWLVDSGSSRHDWRAWEYFSMIEKKLSQRVELGISSNYVVKRVGKESIEMEFGNNVHLRNVLYVLGLKKNIVSIYFLEVKGDNVSFVDGKVLVWSKGFSIDDSRVIGIHDGRLYRLMS